MSSSFQSSTDFSKIFLCSGSDFEKSVVSLMSAQCTRDWKENVRAFIRRAPRHWRANKNVFSQLATNLDCYDYLLNFPWTLNVITFNNLGPSNIHSKPKIIKLLHLFIKWDWRNHWQKLSMLKRGEKAENFSCSSFQVPASIQIRDPLKKSAT